jgi:hypothetical protein
MAEKAAEFLCRRSSLCWCAMFIAAALSFYICNYLARFANAIVITLALKVIVLIVRRAASNALPYG